MAWHEGVSPSCLLQYMSDNTCLMLGGQTFDPGDELTSFIKVKGIMDWLMP